MKEGYKKTELGWIPEDWDIKTNNDIFQFSGGLSISREKLGNSGVNYLHYGDIHKRKENFIDLEFDDQWLPKFNENYGLIKENVRLETGDVVFADASEDYDGIGKSVSIINYENKPFVSGLHTIIGKDKNDILSEQYKRYCFSTESVRKQFRQLATGTSVYGISRENIKKIKLLVPPRKEQEKIADILSTVDFQIDDTDKLIEKTKELKKGLMQRLLTKGIGHKEFKKTEVGEIPVEWEVKKLEDLYIEKIRDFGSFSTTKLIEYVESGIPYLRSENFKENKMLLESISYISKEVDELLDKSYVTKGNILFTKIGNIGSAYLYDGELGEKCNSNATIAKIRVDNEKYSSKYLVYYLVSKQCKKQYIGNIISTPPRINMGEINKLKIILPPLEEQEKISDILSSVDNQIEQYENKKSKLEELKKGLMQQLLTGKIRVKI